MHTLMGVRAPNVLQLPQQWSVKSVVDESSLEEARLLLEEAYVVAIDAEWPPTAAKPCATMVQLALRTPAGLEVVLLLDLLAVGQQEAKELLQPLLRRSSAVKVGYGLLADLRALAAALGPEGPSVVAVSEPVIDLRQARKRIMQHNYRETLQEGADEMQPGLSALVEALLGCPLDKAQQCSEWGARPLSAAQRAYAALDAACLLLVLDRLLLQERRQLRPGDESGEAGRRGGGSADAGGAVESHPVELAGEKRLHGCGVEDGVGAAAGPWGQGSAGRSAEGHTAGGLQQHHDAGDCGRCEGSPHCDVGTGECAGEQESGSPLEEQFKDAEAVAASQGSVRDPEHSSLPAEALDACSASAANAALLAAAASVWGYRLEIGGPGKRAGPRCHPSKQALKGMPAAHTVNGDAFPVPIGCAADLLLGGEPLFVCDVMCQGLARQLRMCGIDAASVPNQRGLQRHVIYRMLVEAAEAEGRCVLTRDRAFLRGRFADGRAFLVRAEGRREQLLEVLGAFRLRVAADRLLSRCSDCNGSFAPGPLSAGELPAGAVVCEGVRLSVCEFWLCSRCGKVYWHGSQCERAITQLMARLTAS